MLWFASREVSRPDPRKLLTKHRMRWVTMFCKPSKRMARLEGFEPPTYRFEVCRSIQLSYRRPLKIHEIHRVEACRSSASLPSRRWYIVHAKNLFFKKLGYSPIRR